MKFIGVLMFSFLLCISSYAQENWSVGNPHSNLRFKLGWEDFSMRTGEFKVFKDNNVSNSREDLSDAAFELIEYMKATSILTRHLLIR